MAGDEFFRTRMGHTFFEGTMPALVRELKKLNDNLEKDREIKLYGSKVPNEDRAVLGLEPKPAKPPGYLSKLLDELAKEAWNSSEIGAHVVGEHILDTRITTSPIDERKMIATAIEELEGIERWAASIRKKLQEEM